MEKPFSVAGSFTVGPEPMPPSQGPCPLAPPHSTWHPGPQGLLGFLSCIPFQPVYPQVCPLPLFVICQKVQFLPSLSFRFKLRVSHQPLLHGARVKVKTWHNAVEKEAQNVSFQTKLGMQNSAPDSPGPRFQLCSIPCPCTLRTRGLNGVLLPLGQSPGLTMTL